MLRQYLLFGSFHALYICTILAGAALIVHGIAMILLVWNGWLVLTLLVIVAARKLVADHWSKS